MKARDSDYESRFCAPMSPSNSSSYLDRVRISNGMDEVAKHFNSLVKYNKKRSVQLINDERLSFPTLFILQPAIEKYSLFPYLNARNKNAMDIVKIILSVKNGEDRSLSNLDQISDSELKWMLETGCKDDGLSSEYDEVLDAVAALLIKEYQDKASLHITTEMAFSRYRKGSFIYDLIWALFESRNPDCLLLIADHLRSSDSNDVELARKLLSFIPCMKIGTASDNERLYACTLDWIRENYRYLYYTGESFQQTSNPAPYAISHEAKYLCKEISPVTGEFLNQLTDLESKLSWNLRNLDDNSRQLLADYSHMLHCQNTYRWNMWQSYPVTEQIRIAETMIGGLP